MTRLTRTFPVLLILLAAALPACSAASDGSAAGSTSGSAAEAVVIHVADFMLDQPDLEVTGPTVTFEVINDGPTPHNVAVRDQDGTVLMTTRDLSVGESQTIRAEIPPGEYVTFCSLPGHESLGIKGSLRVVSP